MENNTIKIHNPKAALLYFPQWQGSGLTNEVETGAKTLLDFFSGINSVNIPLSDNSLETRYNIVAYDPLVAQLVNAQTVLKEKKLEKLLLIAGDCAAEIAPIAYLNKYYNNDLTVIWLDAHGDLNNPESSPSGHFHGMPLRLLLDGEFQGISIENTLDIKKLILAGLRDLDLPEKEFIDFNNLTIVIDRNNWKAQLLKLLNQQRAKNIYVHLDLDVIDPQIFPSLKCPTADGFNPKDIAEFLKDVIRNYNVVGLSLTETTAKSQKELEPIKSILDVYKDYLF